MGAGLLAAAGDIGGSIVSGMFSTANAKRAQGFSEHMANTAHCREVKDLRLAGLNPILSAGGSGAPLLPVFLLRCLTLSRERLGLMLLRLSLSVTLMSPLCVSKRNRL